LTAREQVWTITAMSIRTLTMLNLLTFLHRWVGVALALFMLVWFSTGLSIAFIGSPTVTRGQQLERAASLSPQDGWLSLGEALRVSAAARSKPSAKSEASASPMGGRAGEHPGGTYGEATIVDARLARIDNDPVWLIEDDRGQRSAISALNGAPIEFSIERTESIARHWKASAASTDPSALAYVDTSDAPVGVRNAEALKPFHRFSLEDGAGTQIVVSARTGEVVQVATRAERAFAYVGNWLHLFHWLDALGAGEYRRDVLTWVSFFAASGAVTGLILGWIRWRPGFFGRATYARGRTQPFREFWFKYHFWAGLIGGSFALLWAASGFLSTNPAKIFSQPTASREELARYHGAGLPAIISSWRPSASLDINPDVVEASWSRLGDDAVLLAITRDGARRSLNVEQAKAGFDQNALLAAARRFSGNAEIAAHELLIDYDNYYYPNRRQTAADKPLPVLRVDFQDAGRTSVYIDPVDARLLAKFDSSRRAYRWLYLAVHHWDFGWFRQRWLWNPWMASWIAFGIALSASAVVLGWRRLRRTFAVQPGNSTAAKTAPSLSTARQP
jgi:uncharacterized iron-regulated membrane protein